jgi:[acyl-carrier-protein] S-malonyltransferase
MYAEGTIRPGTMAAIIGLDPAAVEQVCRDTGGTVVPANYNEPRQTVISGEVEAVRQAAELAKQRGALKAVMLPVSGAFHSPLLAESAAEFSDFLQGFAFGEPRFPVITNVSGRPVRTAAELREHLSRQLTSPVRWTDTIESARALGCRRYFEVGSGQVLAGLVRRIDRELAVTALGRASDLDALAGKGG